MVSRLRSSGVRRALATGAIAVASFGLALAPGVGAPAAQPRVDSRVTIVKIHNDKVRGRVTGERICSFNRNVFLYRVGKRSSKLVAAFNTGIDRFWGPKDVPRGYYLARVEQILKGGYGGPTECTGWDSAIVHIAR